MKKIMLIFISCLSLSKIQSQQNSPIQSSTVMNQDSTSSFFTRLSDRVVSGSRALVTKTPELMRQYLFPTILTAGYIGHTRIIPAAGNFLCNHPKSAAIGALVGTAAMISMLKKSKSETLKDFSVKQRLATIGLAAITTALGTAVITYASSTLANRVYNYFDSMSFGRRTYVLYSPYVPGQSNVGFNLGKTKFALYKN